jgi:hypothetical protein
MSTGHHDICSDKQDVLNDYWMNCVYSVDLRVKA